eukprot:361456-Chlamydomonas_euryale.AAC.8
MLSAALPVSAATPAPVHTPVGGRSTVGGVRASSSALSAEIAAARRGSGTVSRPGNAVTQRRSSNCA